MKAREGERKNAAATLIVDSGHSVIVVPNDRDWWGRYTDQHYSTVLKLSLMEGILLGVGVGVSSPVIWGRGRVS